MIRAAIIGFSHMHVNEAALYISEQPDFELVGAADSFGALQTRVEEEGVLTWDDVYDALENNFKDERVRLILNSAPKYCGGGTVSDKWAQ